MYAPQNAQQRVAMHLDALLEATLEGVGDGDVAAPDSDDAAAAAAATTALRALLRAMIDTGAAPLPLLDAAWPCVRALGRGHALARYAERSAWTSRLLFAGMLCRRRPQRLEHATPLCLAVLGAAGPVLCNETARLNTIAYVAAADDVCVLRWARAGGVSAPCHALCRANVRAGGHAVLAYFCADGGMCGSGSDGHFAVSVLHGVRRAPDFEAMGRLERHNLLRLCLGDEDGHGGCRLMKLLDTRASGANVAALDVLLRAAGRYEQLRDDSYRVRSSDFDGDTWYVRTPDKNVVRAATAECAKLCERRLRELDACARRVQEIEQSPEPSPVGLAAAKTALNAALAAATGTYACMVRLLRYVPASVLPPALRMRAAFGSQLDAAATTPAVATARTARHDAARALRTRLPVWLLTMCAPEQWHAATTAYDGSVASLDADDAGWRSPSVALDALCALPADDGTEPLAPLLEQLVARVEPPGAAFVQESPLRHRAPLRHRGVARALVRRHVEAVALAPTPPPPPHVSWLQRVLLDAVLDAAQPDWTLDAVLRLDGNACFDAELLTVVRRDAERRAAAGGGDAVAVFEGTLSAACEWAPPRLLTVYVQRVNALHDAGACPLFLARMDDVDCHYACALMYVTRALHAVAARVSRDVLAWLYRRAVCVDGIVAMWRRGHAALSAAQWHENEEWLVCALANAYHSDASPPPDDLRACVMHAAPLELVAHVHTEYGWRVDERLALAWLYERAQQPGGAESDHAEYMACRAAWLSCARHYLAAAPPPPDTNSRKRKA